MPDFTWKAGDAGPVVTDTLTFSDGTPAPLQGATVTFQMRSLSANAPLPLTGTTSITNNATGAVQFTPTTADTSQPPGAYMATWNVVYQSLQSQTFPTQGYLWGVIEPNLTSEPQQLVSLPEVKDYLNIQNDRTHDNKLIGLIEDATPMIEAITGPIIVRTFDEWHDGGQYWIRLRRRPSTAIGTSPVLNILGCDEYRGPIKYTLSVVADPTAASIYSVMLDARIGTIYRRTTGGGVIPFGAGAWGGGMPDAVHVVYQAGQAQIPKNVRRAVLEAVRDFYQTTMATGTGSRTISDEYERSGPTPGFGDYLDRHARQALRPMRKHPAIA